jgi:cation:H+ antiporter
MTLALLLTLAGLAILPSAADRFVDSAGRLSRRLGVSAVLVGALLVGLGTSLPEALASGIAAWRGNSDFAIGNVVGSNVANLTLVLGVAAFIAPVLMTRTLIRREGLLMLAATVLTVVMYADGEIVTWEAGILLFAMVVAIVLLTRWSEGETNGGEEENDSTVGREVGVALLAMAATVLGAYLLVEGAERLAVELDITSAFVATSIVALGTSLPELATSVAAMRRRQGDLVLGNVIGSNLFNSLAVVGLAGTIGPGVINDGFMPLMIAMIVITIAAGFMAQTRNRLSYVEGTLLLSAFVLFFAAAAPLLGATG